MMEQDLEVAIREIICRLYCKEYCGMLKVEILKECCNCEPMCLPDNTICEPIGFKLTLGLNNREKPLQISFDGTVEEFLNFIVKELRSRKLADTNYYCGYQVIKERCDENE